MSIARVIPRLDIKGPNVIKGIQLDAYRVVGDPRTLAEIYYREGADELIYYDAVASLFRRNSLLDFVRETASRIFVPLTVAGGLRSVDDIRQMLRAGADKVAVNTAAVERPELIEEAADAFGSQCIVASIEAHRDERGAYEIWVDYGRQPTGIDALDWARRAVDLGAGELLVTAIHAEGMGAGFDLELTRRIAQSVPVPVIASGGAGAPDDFVQAVIEGECDAVSAASLFHYHYSEAPRTLWMAFDEPRLRRGEQIDSGNIDFLRGGYGGRWDLMVEPASIPAVKAALRTAGIGAREAPVADVEPRSRGAV